MELGGLKCIRIFFLAWRQEEVWCCYHRFVFFLENENYCHPDAFIADHKVPRRQFVHFSRLVVKQYSYLCSWILFFGGVSQAPLVSEEWEADVITAALTAITCSDLSTFISVMFDRLADLRPRFGVTGLCVCVRLCVCATWPRLISSP